MDLSNIKGYELIKQEYLADLNSDSFVLKHIKSGARVAVLANDDPNKVFYIGFRTPPKDSTGVAHIIEHTVLCGSDKYPSKDPFVELAKGSLNTFLNAMTFPDKTVYPVASCNDKDFKNLMDVYMDAVFHPNIYKNKKIFMQEGWHYELENADSPLKYNGVVYNEMKGAFSSSDAVMSRAVMNSLYPETTYGVESGGDPRDIPSLTYENFIKFHQTYYHPSNSYIYLYGNADMAERLEYLDREYLSFYDELKVDSFPGEQEPFENIREIRCPYPITDEEPLEDNTYLTMNFVADKVLNRELYIAFQILDYALASSQGTPLKKALLEKGIGNDIYSFYENGIYQPYFSIVAKNANEEDKQAFLDTIKETCSDLVKQGFDKDALLAGLNNLEFRYRESDFGKSPRGLVLGLCTLDSWLYDDERVFDNIVCNATFKALREKIDTDYFERLIETYILNNKHASVVVCYPEKGLTQKNEKELSDKLSELKSKMSEAEIENIVKETAELIKYQETPDSEEDLKKIPLLKREDLDRNIRPIINEELEINGHKVLFHEVFTNGISYVRFLFRVKELPASYLPYLKLLAVVMGSLDTDNYDYEKLGYEMDKYTGSMEIKPILISQYDSTDISDLGLDFSIRVFTENIDKALELAGEIVASTHFTDYKRLKELVVENKSDFQANASYSSHSIAISRALSHLNESNKAVDLLGGIGYYRFIAKIADDMDNLQEEVASKLKALTDFIFNKENLLIDFTGTRKDLDELMEQAPLLTDRLPKVRPEFKPERLVYERKNEGFTSSAQVDFVCRAGNFIKKGFEYTGAIKVLKTILGYEYLWNEVRVKGGAYGCMNLFSRNGDSYFVSYRDPNLSKTIDVFEGAADFIKGFRADEQRMTKFIIGTISNMDIPLTPSGMGDRSRFIYLTGVTREIIEKERLEVLECTQQDINSLSELVRAFMADNELVVIGNEELIRGAENKFDSIESLF